MFRKNNPVRLCIKPLCSKRGFNRKLKAIFNRIDVPVRIDRKIIDFWVILLILNFWINSVKKEKDKIILNNGINNFSKVLAGRSLFEISDFGASISGINVPISVPDDMPKPHGVNIS